MGLFRKAIFADEFGRLLFVDFMRGLMDSDSPLFNEKLIRDLKEDPEELDWLYIIEIVIYTFFMMCSAVVLSYRHMAREIANGVESELRARLEPMLLLNSNLDAVEKIDKHLSSRCDQYGRCVDEAKDPGPAWFPGNVVYWNITGDTKENPAAAAIISGYSIKIRDLVENTGKGYRITA